MNTVSKALAAVIFVAIALAGCILLFLLPGHTPEAADNPGQMPANLSYLPTPEWKVGDWWTIEISERADQAATYPPPWSAREQTMTVTGIKNIDGRECYEVSCPRGDGMGTVETIYYDKDTLAPIRRQLNSTTNPRVNITINDFTGLAADFLPRFPANATPVRLSSLSFDCPKADAINTTEYYGHYLNDSNDAVVYRVDLPKDYALGPDKYQIWHPAAPWWLYTDVDRIKARLVDCSWWR